MEEPFDEKGAEKAEKLYEAKQDYKGESLEEDKLLNNNQTFCNCCGESVDECALYPCEVCSNLIGDCCQAPYNQFSQIDYNCCTSCYESRHDED